ncbi:MAG: FmdB family zinc ribbon protein [Thainema sp.]
MPLYEFRCTTCGIFDQWRSMAESSLPAFCPTCDVQGKRIYSPPAINLSSALPSRSRRSEPEVVTQSNREPEKPKFQGQRCGRPWMLNH